VSDTFAHRFLKERCIVAEVGGEGLWRCTWEATVNWRSDRESIDKLQENCVDQDWQRIQVVSTGIQTEALGFEGNGTPTGEWVQHRRHIGPHRTPDLGASLSQQALVGGILPHHELLD
jgi:hypothetical protein